MSKLAPIAILLAASAVMAGCSKNYTAYALTSTGSLIQFSTNNPSSINSTVTVTLASPIVSGDTVVRMAAQPGTTTLYCITADGYLCTIDAGTGAATLVGTQPFTENLGNGSNTTKLTNPVISFDPVGGDLRVISSGFNLLVDLTGTNPAIAESQVGYDSSDGNHGTAPALGGIAYQNPVTGASTTTLYALDSATSSLVRIGDANVGNPTSPNTGDMHTIGSLNASLSVTNTGFAIGPSDGKGYASLQNGSAPILYTVDLGAGTLASLGTIGDGTLTITSLVINP